MSRLVLVIGARGLLGSSVVRGVAARDGWRALPAALPWGHPTFAELARNTVRAMLEESGKHDLPWSVVWAAGAVVTSSPPEAFESERTHLRQFLEILREEGSTGAWMGGLFFASSAGGVYAGSAAPPFTEATHPAPISPYGQFKLDMEAEVQAFAARSGIPVLIGRIANLYGPGQRLDKMQGLISHLAVSRYSGKPVFIYVPLETVRDYIFVDDCARLVLDGMERLATERFADGSVPVVVKILGSGEGVSISTLLGYYRAIAKSPPHAVFGVTSATKHQAIDLRMRSVVWPELDRRERVPVAAGFHATMLDVLRMLQS